MRALQELKGEISPLECIVMQATVPDGKCDPCQEEGVRGGCVQTTDKPLRSWRSEWR